MGHMRPRKGQAQKASIGVTQTAPPHPHPQNTRWEASVDGGKPHLKNEENSQM